MQITLDTATIVTAKEFDAVIDFLTALRRVSFIPDEDRPDAGAQPVKLIDALYARGLPLPPSLDMTPPPPAADPAAVFGGAAAQIPPAVPSVAAAPPPTPAPPSASQPPAPPASSPPTAAAPPVPGAAPAASVELDSTGLPHDARIHAANRAKNQDGSWRAKRGINDDALVARIEAELRAVQALPPGPAPSNVVQLPLAPPAPPAEQPPAAPPAAIAFGTTAAAPMPQPSAVPQSFPELMTALTPAMTQGRVNQALLNEACGAYGIPSLALLSTRPDKIAEVFDYIRARVQL